MLLLDSQAMLWLLDDNPRLGPAARTSISSAPLVHASAASVWELTIKAMLGKVSLPDGFVESLRDQGLTLLDVTAAHAEAIRDFPEIARHDPFDRLLVAQAASEGLRLITADRVLLDLGRPFIVDATT
ncbi:type II toxin-antitoxin system VapC family toxin [Jiangella rhizosphaerae]|uniref:Type II toxin-antitoxin system VapC family toxin n=2 Tax=Jiangella rhizosphaerae TaxID=2293569 RepID=A0A418KRU1_9ACTN|nr:type II toxin-antitoxin system VapC family toxin [Jiangella rhizosphaerae]